MNNALSRPAKVAELLFQFRPAILTCLVAIVCYQADVLAFAFGIPPDHITSFWSVTPFLVAVLLVSSRKMWPVLIVSGLGGMVLADLGHRWSAGSELWFTLGNLAEVLIATSGTLYLFKGAPRLDSVKALAKYSVFAVILAPLISASVGAVASLRSGFWLQWRLWVFADALGFLTVTPAILSWVHEGRAWARKSRNHLELTALAILLVVFGYLTFIGIGPWRSPALLYSLVPILLWAALRLGVKGVSTSMVVIAFLSIWGAAHDRGPFTGQGPLNNALSVQVFLFFAAMPFTVLAILAEEQKQTQQALAEEGDQLAEAQRLAHVGSWWWDPNTDTVTWSDELYRIAGRDPRSAAPSYREFSQLFTPESWERLNKAVQKALRTGEPYELDLEWIRPDGTTMWQTARGEAQRDTKGRVVGLRGTARDITERKRSEEALRRSEGYLSQAERLAHTGCWAWDVPTRDTFWSQEMFRILGYDPEKTRPSLSNFLARVHPEDRSRAELRVNEEASGLDIVSDYRIVLPDGTIRYLQAIGHPIKNESGEVVEVVGTTVDVTKRKLAEEAVRESEERFRLAVQAGKMYAIDWDVATDVVIRSEEASRIHGLKGEQATMTHQQIVARVHPEDQATFIRSIAELSPESPNTRTTFRVLRPDGSVLWLERTGHAFFDEQGKIVRMIGIVADVTDRKLAERELTRANERLRLAMEVGKSVGWDWDVVSGRDFWSGDLQSIFGIPAETFTGRVEDFIGYIHSEDRERVLKAVADARHNRTHYAAEYRIVRPDGKIRWVSARGKFEYASNGEAIRMFGLDVDITDLKEASAARQLSERRFSQFFETMPEYAYMISPQGKIMDVNPAACQALGYSREELLGEPKTRIYAPESHAKWRNLFETWQKTGRLRNEEMIILTKSGERRTVLLNLGSVMDSEGKLLHSASVQVDITERKAAEDKLLEYARAVEGVEDMVVVIDREFRYLIANNQYLKMRNMTKDQVLGRYVYEILDKGLFETVVKQKVDECFQGKVVRYEMKDTYPELGERDVLVSYFPIEGATGVDRVACIIQDITERKQVDEALSTVSQRLIEAHEEERARLARELHDDINQRLALLAVSLTGLKESLSAESVELGRKIDEASKQISDVGSDVQGLSHRLHSSKLEYLGLEKAAAGFCRECSDQQGVEIHFYSENVPNQLAPEISLSFFRVLQEALQNAAKHSGSRQFQVSLKGQANEVELTVHDSGIGFDPEQAIRGRGLGLTSMRERLKLVGGELLIDSQVQRGTTVHARIPLSARPHSVRAGGQTKSLSGINAV